MERCEGCEHPIIPQYDLRAGLVVRLALCRRCGTIVRKVYGEGAATPNGVRVQGPRRGVRVAEDKA